MKPLINKEKVQNRTGKMKTEISRKEQIRQSKDELQTRSYQRKRSSSWAKLKIRDEDGWDKKMRSLYYDMNNHFTTYILKNDMTDIKKRSKNPDGTPISKRNVKQKNGYAPGLWSDGKVDKTLGISDELVRFIIRKDKEKAESGFFKENPKVKPVTRISDINQHHLNEFVQHKLDGGVAVSSVRRYVGDLQKVFESTSAADKGIKSHKSLMQKCSGDGSVVKVIEKHVVDNGGKEKEFRSKEKAIRSVGKTDGEKGYSLKNARAIIEWTKKDPMVNLAMNVFTYIGTREGAIRDMVWSDVLDESGKIREEMDFMHDGQMKAGRKQVAEVNESKHVLEEIYENGGYSPFDTIFGNASRYKLEKPLKQACDDLGIDYKAIHAFRSATLEYYETEKVPEMTEGLSNKEKKELIAQELLKLASVEVVDKDGKLTMLHNPMVKKQVKQKVPKRDKNGNIVRNKKGNPIMVIKMKKEKNGNMVPDLRTVIGVDGQPVMERRYTMEKLMDMQFRTLTGLYSSQQLSHNRLDANAPYRNYKKRKED